MTYKTFNMKALLKEGWNTSVNPTAVEWLVNELNLNEDSPIVIYAKEKEKNQEYDTKLFWFRRGVLAGREDKITELKPTRKEII